MLAVSTSTLLDLIVGVIAVVVIGVVVVWLMGRAVIDHEARIRHLEREILRHHPDADLDP